MANLQAVFSVTKVLTKALLHVPFLQEAMSRVGVPPTNDRGLFSYLSFHRTLDELHTVYSKRRALLVFQSSDDSQDEVQLEDSSSRNMSECE